MAHVANADNGQLRGDRSVELRVAATLENLAGERMVGVITHVPALADRIPVRFQVTRTGARSQIERITA